MEFGVFKPTTFIGCCNSAAEILQDHLDRKEFSERDLDGARGVVIFGAKRVAMGACYANGSGIVVARKKNHKWSLPAVFSMTFVGGGTAAGAELYTSVRLLDDAEFEECFIRQAWKCDMQLAATVGPWGWTGLLEDQKLVPQHKTSKGVFGGVMSGATNFKEDKDLNAKFYGRKIAAAEIFDGNFTMHGMSLRDIESFTYLLSLLNLGKEDAFHF